MLLASLGLTSLYGFVLVSSVVQDISDDQLSFNEVINLA